MASMSSCRGPTLFGPSTRANACRCARRSPRNRYGGFAVSSSAAPRSLARYAIGYGIRLAAAHLMAISAAIAIVIPLGLRPIRGLLAANLLTAMVVIAAQAVALVITGALMITPSLRWYLVGAHPDSRQQRAARRLVRRQSIVIGATWLFGAAAVILVNLND